MERVLLSGATTVHVFFEGRGEGDAADNDGDGLDEVTTEMVLLELTGTSSLGPVGVFVDPVRRSLGQIEESSNATPGVLDLPPFTPTGTADSFFDVFVGVNVYLNQQWRVFHTSAPKRMRGLIRHKPPGPGDVYESFEPLELRDENDMPTGIVLISARHLPRPECEFADSDHDHDVDDDDHARLVRCLAGPHQVPPILECSQCFDFDFDGDIDLMDTAAFFNAFGRQP